MVIERGTRLYVMDMDENPEPMPLEIQVAADMIENPVQIKNQTGGADELAVSSDGEEYAMIVDGEIVLVNRELGGRATVAVPGPSREEGIEFRPGSADTLSFVTDRFGRKTLCLLVSDDPDEKNLRLAREHKIIELGKGKVPTHSASWSPDGDRIAYIKGNADLHVMDPDGSDDITLFEHWSQPAYSWSPDGNWIAFHREDNNFNTDIWIMPSDGGEAVNISQHPDDDLMPHWSENGQMLIWSTERHENQFDIYSVYLKREDDERTREEWEIWEKTRDKVKKEEKKDEESDEEGDDAEEEEEFTIEIDFDEIHLRARRMTSLPDAEYAVAIHPKGDKVFFTASVEGDRDLYAVNRFGEEMEALTSGGTNPQYITFSAENETFYFLQRGRPQSMGMGGGSSEGTDFKARITYDKPATRLQILDEGWRILNDNFYDPEMHGVDWEAKHEKYSQWARNVGHDRDFADVVNLMLGELNASHMGYYPDWDTRRSSGPDGYLGVHLDREYEGRGLRIESVIAHGPADKVKTRLLPGDILLEVNGMEVGADMNLYAALEERADLPTEIRFERDGEVHEYELVPAAYRELFSLLYREMERKNRDYVEEVSGGDVGYLHIRGMSLPEVERFEMNLYAAADDKDALIIDVRDNGGGWTTDMLMTILTQPVHAYTVPRNGGIGYPQPRYPLYRWEKPIAVICNEGSYSNAEIFSHATKTINRGPLVGKTTGGNVISTGGWQTLDGGWIRLPFRGWYVWGDETDPQRNNLNEEGNGAVPDYPVDFTPADRMYDRDPQLDKAIELMDQAAQEWRDRPDPSPQPFPWRLK